MDDELKENPNPGYGRAAPWPEEAITERVDALVRASIAFDPTHSERMACGGERGLLCSYHDGYYDGAYAALRGAVL